MPDLQALRCNGCSRRGKGKSGPPLWEAACGKPTYQGIDILTDRRSPDMCATGRGFKRPRGRSLQEMRPRESTLTKRQGSKSGNPR